MNITHRKPFGGLMDVQDTFGRFLDEDFLKEFGFPTTSFSRWNPAADLYETKDNYIFKMEVPGVEKDQIDIQYHDNTLTVKGERHQDSDIKEENVHRMERFVGSFSRSFTLPAEADAAKINAALKDGILELRIPKTEAKKSRSIPINLDN